LVGEVVEVSEVHEDGGWASIWVEGSCHGLEVSTVLDLVKLVES
jgi:hypothetical protein